MKIFLKFLPFLVIALVFVFTGCNETITEEGTDVEETGVAGVRYIHSASSTEELDFTYISLTDNNTYAVEQNTTYGHQYGYFSFTSGEREFILYEGSSSIELSTAAATLEPDHIYTVIACDYEATLNPDMLFVEDTLAVAPENTSFVRFINLSANRNSMNLSEAGIGNIISGLEYRGSSPYISFDSGTYNFTLTDPGSGDVLLGVPPMTFLSGNNYTVIFSGTTTNLTTTSLNARSYRET